MKAAVVAAAVVVSPLLFLGLLGAGFAAAAKDDAPAAEQPPSAETVPAGSGCTVPDPSGTGGCVTPALAGVMAQVERRFGHLPVACWSARGGDPYSDHPKG